MFWKNLPKKVTAILLTFTLFVEVEDSGCAPRIFKGGGRRGWRLFVRQVVAFPVNSGNIQGGVNFMHTRVPFAFSAAIYHLLRRLTRSLP